MTPCLMARLCRLYSVLLYAYPADFRRQYGPSMQQLFRDRCRDFVRGTGSAGPLGFVFGMLADWLRSVIQERAAGTILIYLFATTTLVQAYVVPTGSMEGTIMVGDHMLVDRLSTADPGAFGHHLLPYREVERGDIVAFLYPEDVRQTYVKRIIGVPGDRIRLENGQVIRNGHRLVEPYTQHIAAWRTARLWSHRACCSPWATTVTTRWTAAIGASCRGVTWWAGPCWSTGRTMRPPRTCRSGASGTSSTWRRISS
jgi:signal peptidase I